MVYVLHAHDRRDRLPLGDLFRRRVAQPEVPDQALLLEFESRDAFTVASQDEDHPFSLGQYMSGTLSGQPGCTGTPGNCACRRSHTGHP